MIDIYEAFVYQWINLTTNHKYIGYHKGNENDGYISSSRYFNEDYNTNPSNFKREILARGSTKEMVILETKFLKEVDAARNPNFYNRHNGDGNIYNIGPHSEKTKLKISLANTGKKHSEESIIKMRDKAKARPSNRKGISLTPEHKSKLRAANIGKKASPETINKMKRRTGEKNPFYGKVHSVETKKRISDAKKHRI